jgi:thioredoxin 1
MSTPTTVQPITDADVASLVGPGSGLVAIDFGAAWCPPCRLMEPIVEAVAAELGAAIRVYSMDTDAHPATMVRYGVRGLPTILVFRDGEIMDRIIGATSKKKLEERFRNCARQ